MMYNILVSNNIIETNAQVINTTHDALVSNNIIRTKVQVINTMYDILVSNNIAETTLENWFMFEPKIFSSTYDLHWHYHVFYLCQVNVLLRK